MFIVFYAFHCSRSSMYTMICMPPSYLTNCFLMGCASDLVQVWCQTCCANPNEPLVSVTITVVAALLVVLAPCMELDTHRFYSYFAGTLVASILPLLS